MAAAPQISDDDIRAEIERRATARAGPQDNGPPDSPYTNEAIAAEIARRKVAPTPAAQSVPPVQDNVAKPPETGVFGKIANAITGNDRKDPKVGEAYFTPVPEEKDQQFEGPLAPIANLAPKGVRNWVGAEMKADGIGLGQFLDADPTHQAIIIKHNVPEAEFRRDKFGNVQVRYQPDADPEKGWAYLNAPGLSPQDALTFAQETAKFLTTQRIPLLRAGKLGEAVPLATSTAKAAGAGAIAAAAGQTAATAFGGPGPDIGDVAVGGAGAAGGNVVGHGAGAVATAAPALIRDGINAVADRLPGGATRAAERLNLAQLSQDAATKTAQALGEAHARATAAAQGVQGAALQKMIDDAHQAAADAVAKQFSATGPAARAIDSLAQSFGIKLAKSQAEGDQHGLTFLHEAMGGLHGPGAQKQATAFLEAQSRALPAAIKSIAGDQSVLNPTAGVGAAREGVLAAKQASDAAEGQAWDKYNAAVRNVRTRANTPAGAPGGVTLVVRNMLDTLNNAKVHMDVPEYATAYPHVRQVLDLANRMMDVTDSSTLKDVPDVDRIIQLKRFIDAKYEEAGTNSERRLLSQLGAQARGWLKSASEGSLGRRAPVTAAALKDALALSEQSAKIFRENPVMQDILATRRGVGGADAGGAQFTDAEIAQRLFGGGNGGLNLRGDSVGALHAIKEAVGASSPEWESLRQAALQRLSEGLDTALANRQAPPVLTTTKYINDALNKSNEGLSVLFSPQELARLRDVNSVLRAAAPPAKNMANPAGSGMVAGRVMKGLFEQALTGARAVPGVSAVAGGLQDAGAAARTNIETAGPAGPGFNIAKRLADLWNVRGSNGATAGFAGADTERQNEPGQ